MLTHHMLKMLKRRTGLTIRLSMAPENAARKALESGGKASSPGHHQRTGQNSVPPFARSGRCGYQRANRFIAYPGEKNRWQNPPTIACAC